MELQHPFGGLGRHGVALLVEDRRQPERLPGSFLRVDLALAPPGIGDDEPDQARSHDEPDDEQPPVELGIHHERRV